METKPRLPESQGWRKSYWPSAHANYNVGEKKGHWSFDEKLRTKGKRELSEAMRKRAERMLSLAEQD